MIVVFYLIPVTSSMPQDILASLTLFQMLAWPLVSSFGLLKVFICVSWSPAGALATFSLFLKEDV